MENAIIRAIPTPEVDGDHDVVMENPEYISPPQCIWNRNNVVINVRIDDEEIEVFDEESKFDDFWAKQLRWLIDYKLEQNGYGCSRWIWMKCM